jgi:uncharacterized membrane protein
MTHRFNLFLVALVCFGLLDGLWLGVLMRAFYRSQLSLIARMSGDRLAPLFSPALMVYVLLAWGMVAFVLPRPVVEAPVLRGALFGFVVYGVYDLTNLKTLKGWPLVLTAIDIAWGATASATTAWVVTIANPWIR